MARGVAWAWRCVRCMSSALSLCTPYHLLTLLRPMRWHMQADVPPAHVRARTPFAAMQCGIARTTRQNAACAPAPCTDDTWAHLPVAHHMCARGWPRGQPGCLSQRCCCFGGSCAQHQAGLAPALCYAKRLSVAASDPAGVNPKQEERRFKRRRCVWFQGGYKKAKRRTYPEQPLRLSILNCELSELLLLHRNTRKMHQVWLHACGPSLPSSTRLLHARLTNSAF